MPVPNQTPYIIYNANGLTTVFPFEFYVISAADIQVTINGTEVSSGYTVSGVGNVAGGDVVFVTPPASGAVVMLERVVPTYRLTDYQDNGDLLADTVNKDFDRLWMAIQRSFIYLGLALRRPLLGGPFDAEGYRISNGADPVDKQDFVTRNYAETVYLVKTLRVPEADVAQIPSADLRANKLLAFNYAGQPIAVLPGTGSASEVMIELAKPTGTSLIGDESGLTLQERLHYDTSDIALYGYVYGSGADAKQPILDAITRTGKAHVSGDITLSRFDWPEGAKLEGKGTITYTRRPSVPCELDSYTPVNHSKMKAVWVYGVFDICDMLQLKTAGFNTIIHYGYNFTDGGTFEKACNAAEAVGINVIINSPNDVPLPDDVSLGYRDCVIGYYIFDEPQLHGISVSAQNVRVSAWRSATNKQLCIADSGVFSFDTPTISNDYDIIFVDSYFIASVSDADNKGNALTAWCELGYKSKHATLIPAVGLFTGDNASDKQKNINFSKAFFKCGDGAYAAFSWESSVADPSHYDIITDSDFYETAKILNTIHVQNNAYIEYFLFGPGVGLGGAMRTLNATYTSPDVKPFRVISSGSAIDERHQVFGDTGIAFRNAGGVCALNIRLRGSVVCRLGYRDHSTGSSSTVEIFYTPDDYYTSTPIISKVLTHNTGFSKCAEVAENVSLGLRLTPTTSVTELFKFVSGSIISSSWKGDTF
ncbi:phage tail fiber protein [Citrobacter amalonaticus]|uniref:phage tail fiber domain-containing protein n=1 Tax=Citrobacter amalonaticus TaxID=35703 RepID=UPI00292C0663|nr:phage tail fiber protein [Citrobacter amalonaticus]MDV0787664.1 phage tail fiber protein [Citrobacter amalonaticus]MEB0643728.1 phage tail fiber protein [Citrobacter amalonaticus]